jgi:hypothetical protein
MQTSEMSMRSRLIWAGIGAAMLAAGSRRRTSVEAACGAIGCGMLVWALAAPTPPVRRDIVDVSSDDSFPASDPPSTW